MTNTSAVQCQPLLQKKDMLVLTTPFNLGRCEDLEGLTSELVPFDEARANSDTGSLHLVTADDGEWQRGLNESGLRGDIGFGTKPLGMKPFFVESPTLGLGLEPTFDTNWAFSHLFGCTDRLETEPSKTTRRKLIHHKFIFFSPTDIRITFKTRLEYLVWLMGQFNQRRRIAMADKYQHPAFMGIVLTDEDGNEFDLYLRVYDICGLVGIAGYEEAAKVAKVKGFSASSKRLMKEYKERMTDAYKDRHDEFIEYALNDLLLLEIVQGIDRLWKSVCKDMGVKPIKLHLTMGANVVAFNESVIEAKLFPHGTKQLFKLDEDGEVLTDEKGRGIPRLSNPHEVVVRKSGKSAKNIVNIEDLLTFFNREASAQWLAVQNHDNKYGLAAVDGGRCKNELPRRTRIVDVRKKGKKTVIKAVVCDNDIDGCYGNGLMNQLYPIGRPTILSFKSSAKNRPTLGEFVSNKGIEATCDGVLRLYKGFFDDLIPGLWYARFSTTSPLSYCQDLLISKLGLKPKSTEEVFSKGEANIDPDDLFSQGNECEVGGEFVLLQKELVSVTLTHDLLQCLRKVCTDKEWGELREKLVLDAVIYYPRSKQVKTTEELIAAYELEQEEVSGFDTDNKRVDKDNRCQQWLALDMGKGWVDKLAGLRKTYRKKTAENTFYKLIINCIYGVACSVFFPTFSNVVVANNITARARTLAWMMAKVSMGQASITDGSMSDLNRYLYWKGKRPGMNTLSSLDNFDALSKDVRKCLKVAPLSINNSEVWEPGSEWGIVGHETNTYFDEDKGEDVSQCITTLSNGTDTITGKANGWAEFDSAIWRHMAHFFGEGIDIIDKPGKVAWGNPETGETGVKERKGQFAFEVKDMYASAAFQSQSNYLAVSANGEQLLRARGQNPYKAQYLDPYGTSQLEKAPMLEMLEEILDNTPITPKRPIYTPTVLKLKAWAISAKSQNKKGNVVQSESLLPGDTTHKPSHLKPISVSMFRYQTESQYQSWKKQQEKLRQSNGWGIEGLYVDEDGCLDYDSAVKAVQDAIDDGKGFPRLGKKEFPTHPYKPTELEFNTEESELLTDIDW